MVYNEFTLNKDIWSLNATKKVLRRKNILIDGTEIPEDTAIIFKIPRTTPLNLERNCNYSIE